MADLQAVLIVGGRLLLPYNRCGAGGDLARFGITRPAYFQF